MDKKTIVFGDVFRFREVEYVFLAKTEAVVYAARILDPELSRKVKDLFNRVRNSPEKIRSHPAYCFVELQTEGFRDRIAHFANAGSDRPSNAEGHLSFDIIRTLEKVDLEQIKTEITGGPVDLELKRLVGKIDLS